MSICPLRVPHCFLGKEERCYTPSDSRVNPYSPLQESVSSIAAAEAVLLPSKIAGLTWNEAHVSTLEQHPTMSKQCSVREQHIHYRGSSFSSSPPFGNILSDFLGAWKAITIDRWVLSTVELGYVLQQRTRSASLSPSLSLTRFLLMLVVLPHCIRGDIFI